MNAPSHPVGQDDLDLVGAAQGGIFSALGMLSALRRTFDLLCVCTAARFALATNSQLTTSLPTKMISRPTLFGVFQIESRAQMAIAASGQTTKFLCIWSSKWGLFVLAPIRGRYGASLICGVANGEEE